MRTKRRYRDIEIKGIKFPIGEALVSNEIAKAMKNNDRYLAEIFYYFTLFCNGTWANSEPQEKINANNRAIETGTGQIAASYTTSRGKILITTASDRSCTKIRFAD